MKSLLTGCAVYLTVVHLAPSPPVRALHRRRHVGPNRQVWTTTAMKCCWSTSRVPSWQYQTDFLLCQTLLLRSASHRWRPFHLLPRNRYFWYWLISRDNRKSLKHGIIMEALIFIICCDFFHVFLVNSKNWLLFFREIQLMQNALCQSIYHSRFPSATKF